MEQNSYPIRQALKAQDIKQEELAKRLNVSRQTLVRYLTQFETSGYVGNPDAQREFERLIAIEKQRLSGMQDNRSRLEVAKLALSDVTERERNNRIKYERFLREVLANHPDVTMYDYEDKPVTAETLDLKRMWVNFGIGENDGLDAVLTDAERAKLEEITKEFGETFRVSLINTKIEDACLMEQIWDSTKPSGKPMVYHDEFEYALSDEVTEDGMYHFSCETFSMCNGGMARIYVDDLIVPHFEHKVEMDVFAVVEVVSDKGMMYIDTVNLDRPGNNLFRFVGRIDDLIPGYKYVYSVGITAGDYDEVNDLEYTLLEGYSARSHPLK